MLKRMRLIVENDALDWVGLRRRTPPPAPPFDPLDYPLRMVNEGARPIFFSYKNSRAKLRANDRKKEGEGKKVAATAQREGAISKT